MVEIVGRMRVSNISMEYLHLQNKAFFIKLTNYQKRSLGRTHYQMGEDLVLESSDMNIVT